MTEFVLKYHISYSCKNRRPPDPPIRIIVFCVARYTIMIKIITKIAAPPRSFSATSTSINNPDTTVTFIKSLKLLALLSALARKNTNIILTNSIGCKEIDPIWIQFVEPYLDTPRNGIKTVLRKPIPNTAKKYPSS